MSLLNRVLFQLFDPPALLPWICHSWRSCCLLEKNKTVSFQFNFELLQQSYTHNSCEWNSCTVGAEIQSWTQQHVCLCHHPCFNNNILHDRRSPPFRNTLCISLVALLVNWDTCKLEHPHKNTWTLDVWLLIYLPTGWWKETRWPQRTPDLQHVVCSSLQKHKGHHESSSSPSLHVTVSSYFTFLHSISPPVPLSSLCLSSTDSLAYITSCGMLFLNPFTSTHFICPSTTLCVAAKSLYPVRAFCILFFQKHWQKLNI